MALTIRSAAATAGLLSHLFALSAHAEFASFRYDDDFSNLRGDDGYAQLKHIDLGSAQRYLSIGGDIRERVEFYSQSHIGADAVQDDLLLLHRLLLHANLHWDGVRLFAQIGNYDEEGREPAPRPTDVDYLDTRQLFVEWRGGLGSADIALRAGRQEMAFGASRLITARDGPNIRLAFDGVRADLFVGGWKLTALAVRPAENTPGDFDDGTVDTQSLWGVYGSGQLATTWRTDLYFLRSSMESMRYENASGDETRSTLGWRLYGKSGAWDNDVELMLQYGDIAGQTIRAFALATDSGWTLSQRGWKPRLGLRTDIISGDSDAGDAELGTFNALYPNGAYFSEASVLAQANLLDLSLSLTLKPQPALTLAWSLNPLWRYSTDDAVYTLPLRPLLAADSSSKRYIGVQNQLLATWQVNDYLSLRLALVAFNAGDAVQAADGGDLDYAQLATNIRF